MNALTKYGEGNPLDGDGAVQVHQHVDAGVARIAALLRIPVYRERDLEQVERRIKDVAKLEGDALYYEFPVRQKNGQMGKVIGPSVKLAYALVNAYGNCATDCEVVDTDEAWIFNATFVDRETGSVNSRLFRQRKGQESVKTDKERMQDIAFQIGQSKAIRNVVVNSLRHVADRAVELAQEAIVTKIEKKPEAFRDKAVKRLAEYGIGIERVNAVIGSGPDQWKPIEIARVISGLQAITDGVARAEDVWPTPQQEAPPAPPPPGGEPETKGKKPAAKKEAAPKAEGPPDNDAEFATWLIGEFTAAGDVTALDTLWERHEKRFPDLAVELQGHITKAYDDRRTALDNPEG
jgi:hypothetical protein